ncbi:MAG: hypothetical protein U9Q82_10265 [Chloroflexota bacterium]|nr:hypothetical protein [Chloroflexota bacterium]
MNNSFLRYWIGLLVLVALNACASPLTPAHTPTVQVVQVTPTPIPIKTTPFIPSRHVRAPTITPSAIPASPTPQPTSRPLYLLFPDAELVYSPTALDFDTSAYLHSANGFLSTYEQYLMMTGWASAADIINLVALENSINPRLLLALLEYQSGCVLGHPTDAENFDTALGAQDYYRKDLYGQLVWAVRILSEGFYGWRTGTLTMISFSDGTVFRPPPQSNAGTVSVQYFFAQLYNHDIWEQALDTRNGFPALYERMFGDAWERAANVEHLVSADLSQPLLTLPFEPGETWAYTGGPHPAFEGNGPLAALDFAPRTEKSGCIASGEWVVAVADGLVVRSNFGAVIQDLDGDGHEQTGWAVMYLHIDEQDCVDGNVYLRAGERVGHPSCEGGRATGTHLHIVRKYNGVWIAADGTIPFVLDGWSAHAGEAPYKGTLTRGTETVTAHEFGSAISLITRDE